MRVKEMSLQGFKSFASKHRFVFPQGITAVVGPNGSGKSNIADAVRWVLGEHRATSLRAKRTAQMIFAGTEKRPRAGLAEVTLTFDNESGWLDVDFSEVVIGRRALRDGTNTYSINGAPVRLRDILDLLGGHVGQGAYTVIGQGLVDNALSMRPEERRVLIDEAAGIVPLQRRRNTALRRLGETDENLTRVADLQEELGPQLRRLSRLAERAERHEEVLTELRDALVSWYGFQWRSAREQLAASSSATRGIEEAAQEARNEAATRSATLRGAEQESEEAGNALEKTRAQRAELAAELSNARQAAAVSKARLDGLAIRLQEVASAGDVEGEALSDRRDRIHEIRENVELLEAEHNACLAAAAESTKRLSDCEMERDGHAAAIEQAQASLLELRSTLAAERHRIESAGQAVVDRRKEQHAARAEQVSAEAALAERATELKSAAELLETADAERAKTAERVAAAEGEMRAAVAELSESQTLHARSHAELEALRARSEALDALFGGLDASQAVARVMEKADGVEIVGSVAELIEIDDGWQDAAAAALGEWVHGVVVRDVSDIDGALHVVGADTRSGLTLIPLRGAAQGHRDWPQVSGDGRASEIVRAPGAEGLVEALLGGTLFTSDIASARAALSRAAPPSRAVTRDGVLVLPCGVVTVGTAARETLQVQRERRELPAAIERTTIVLDERLERVDSLTARRRELETRLGELASERIGRDDDYRAAADALAAHQAACSRIERERDWYTDAAERLGREIEVLEGQIVAAREVLARREPEEAEHVADLAEQRSRLDAVDLTDAREAAAQTGSRASSAAQRLAGRKAMLDAAREDMTAAEARLATEQARGETVAHEAADLETEAGHLHSATRQLTSRLEALDAELAPAEAAAKDTRAGLHGLLSAVEEARGALSTIESRLVDARVAETRAGDRLERLADQLRGDAELVGWDAGPAASVEAVAELTAADLGLAEVDDVPADLDEHIASLRRRLRVIGSIDHEALATYRETDERHEHLQTQRADLEQARADVTEVLDALDSEMAARFDETFAAVAGAFEEFFPQLFGGGEAELILRGDDGESPGISDGEVPGIDIVARPPGKRRQPLELLSGGERSLTAVALIFALLRVSRTPFAVLDEVDAALDEANVGRFRVALQALAEETQVVIITHNRGTIQVADTVYGVTMQEDGASQVISLRVGEPG
jgi:chromosome segregation protein